MKNEQSGISGAVMACGWDPRKGGGVGGEGGG